MKKNKKLIPLLLPVVFCLLFLSCVKKAQDTVPVLPEISNTGTNTMGAMVDGEIWVPSKSLGITTRSLCTHYNTDDGLYLYLVHSRPGSSYHGGDGIIIKYKPVLTVGNYDLTDTSKTQIQVIVENIDGYDSFSISKGTLIITRLDLTNKIISGQFSFTAINKKTNTVHNVTSGRFDVQLNYCQ